MSGTSGGGSAVSVEVLSESVGVWVRTVEFLCDGSVVCGYVLSPSPYVFFLLSPFFVLFPMGAMYRSPLVAHRIPSHPRRLSHSERSTPVSPPPPPCLTVLPGSYTSSARSSPPPSPGP